LKAQALWLLLVWLSVRICIPSIHMKYPAVVDTMLEIKLHAVLLQSHTLT